MVPAFGMAVVLFRALPALQRVVPATTERRLETGKDDVRAMTLLSVVIGLRSVAWFGLLTFVPLWVVANGGTEGEGGRTLSLMLVSGAVGTLVLGPVADRVGLRRTLLVTQAALPFLVVTFVSVGGVVGTIALMLVGLCVVGTFGVTMVLSQLYLPRHVGVASGLSVGLAMGLGGIAAVVLGAVADVIDLQTALYVAAAAPALGCIACLMLPRPASFTPKAQPEPAPAAIV
jgi:FSR family fosmidomycin resistance protein-like MFS transporter